MLRGRRKRGFMSTRLLLVAGAAQARFHAEPSDAGGLSALLGMTDLRARTEELYDEIRHGQALEILEETLPGGAASGPLDIQLTDSNGEAYVCSVPRSSNLGDGQALDGDNPSFRLAATRVDPLASLEGRCDTLSLGWWSYEWCHRDQIRQFHIDHAEGKVSGGALASAWKVATKLEVDF